MNTLLSKKWTISKNPKLKKKFLSKRLNNQLFIRDRHIQVKLLTWGQKRNLLKTSKWTNMSLKRLLMKGLFQMRLISWNFLTERWENKIRFRWKEELKFKGKGTRSTMNMGKKLFFISAQWDVGECLTQMLFKSMKKIAKKYSSPKEKPLILPLKDKFKELQLLITNLWAKLKKNQSQRMKFPNGRLKVLV